MSSKNRTIKLKQMKFKKKKEEISLMFYNLNERKWHFHILFMYKDEKLLPYYDSSKGKMTFSICM